ncbi:MAG: hypothetical protein ABJE66_06705 [Deltaproteobacteria bacterium]
MKKQAKEPILVSRPKPLAAPAPYSQRVPSLEAAYFRNCRGHGFLSRHGDELAYNDLAGPEPTNWWAHQVFSGGVRLVVVGIAACIAALIAFAIAGARLKPAT